MQWMLLKKINPSLRGVLPKYCRQEKLDKTSLVDLVNLVGTLATIGTKEAHEAKILLGKYYEYFLGRICRCRRQKRRTVLYTCKAL
jgi:hypothetical protein